MRATLSIIILPLLFISCQKMAAPLPEEVLKKAVQAHGGASVFEAGLIFNLIIHHL